MNNFQYYARFSPELDGGYSVEFPDIKGAITCGEDLEDALDNAKECLSGMLETMLDMNKDIPTPKKHKGPAMVLITPELDVQIALLIRQYKSQTNLTTADLAKSLGTSWASLNRIEKAGSNPTIKQISRVAAALGKDVTIDFA